MQARLTSEILLAIHGGAGSLQPGRDEETEIRRALTECLSAGGEVLVPGEKERQTKAQRLVTGLPLSEQAWDDILRAAHAAGLNLEKGVGGE